MKKKLLIFLVCCAPLLAFALIGLWFAAVCWASGYNFDHRDTAIGGTFAFGSALCAAGAVLVSFWSQVAVKILRSKE